MSVMVFRQTDRYDEAITLSSWDLPGDLVWEVLRVKREPWAGFLQKKRMGHSPGRRAQQCFVAPSAKKRMAAGC